ncbi:MAG: hypothetical protein NZ872_00875 [Archaeoglobaceae archaeon]|nr:hypothetical protein [Archaeoglobaceae archaeon]MDW8127752.1 hypothetical protein [Archaeoglobaceae archaeon]
MKAHERFRLGLAYAPEDRKLYPDFTIIDNILFPARILLYEPLEGLAPVVRSRLASGIAELKNEGVSVLMESMVSYVKKSQIGFIK